MITFESILVSVGATLILAYVIILIVRCAC
jgi:hypothetical protein